MRTLPSLPPNWPLPEIAYLIEKYMHYAWLYRKGRKNSFRAKLNYRKVVLFTFFYVI